MVGGLVEEEDVGFLEEEAAEGDAAAFAAAEVGDELVVVGAAEGVHGAVEALVEVPGVVLFEQFGQLALPLDEFVEVGVGLGEGVVDLLVFAQQVDGLLDGLLYHLAHGLAVVEAGLLLEVADGVARGEDDLALVVLVDTGDDLHEARLAAAVEADDADLGAIVEREVDVFQDLTRRRDEFSDTDHREYDFFVVGHRGWVFRG